MLPLSTAPRPTLTIRRAASWRASFVTTREASFWAYDNTRRGNLWLGNAEGCEPLLCCCVAWSSYGGCDMTYKAALASLSLSLSHNSAESAFSTTKWKNVSFIGKSSNLQLSLPVPRPPQDIKLVRPPRRSTVEGILALMCTGEYILYECAQGHEFCVYQLCKWRETVDAIKANLDVTEIDVTDWRTVRCLQIHFRGVAGYNYGMEAHTAQNGRWSEVPRRVPLPHDECRRCREIAQERARAARRRRF